ncbi:hypothetical protein PPO43_00060 [Saprospira sp. CCB-QB6]|uniref:hypothetical protein n=1 Tax=Saprospira sp. CCB-QB6 TaxID=3023936 RepID=UPI00234A8A9D|nr:hypothetical protein [Saprospira sp. CCB-QB6]WCL81488.1 hypothetical protein PPO43_00060 [Saprospira sp. CCB-QB6]
MRCYLLILGFILSCLSCTLPTQSPSLNEDCLPTLIHSLKNNIDKKQLEFYSAEANFFSPSLIDSILKKDKDNLINWKYRFSYNKKGQLISVVEEELEFAFLLKNLECYTYDKQERLTRLMTCSFFAGRLTEADEYIINYDGPQVKIEKRRESFDRNGLLETKYYSDLKPWVENYSFHIGKVVKVEESIFFCD